MRSLWPAGRENARFDGAATGSDSMSWMACQIVAELGERLACRPI
jgi:hypothetical protein